MKPGAAALLVATAGALSACGGKTLSVAGDAAAQGTADASAAPMPYAKECVGAAVPPATLECTGLYLDLANKALAPDVEAYAPAVPLWSDGAEKHRYIRLPPGSKIDAKDSSEWVFPVGTKVWKEFVRDGRRIETRLWQKIQSNFWVRATYRWSDDEKSAATSAGGDIALTDGGVYHIPTGSECDQCHRGRTDKLLGFEQVSLGLAGATGLTLSELVARGLIAPAPARTTLTIGDDGTGVAAAPLAWLHVNCGVSCHNDNSNSSAYGASQRLRLDPSLLDGRSSAAFSSLLTTVNHTADTPAWAGQIRIVPGDPAASLLVKLISNRGTDNPVSNQMPPIATLLVDRPDTQAIIAWIAAMASNAPMDASVSRVPDAALSDAGGDALTVSDGPARQDASVDATTQDAALEAESQDAGDEATLLDAAGDDSSEATASDGGTADGP